MKKFTKRQQFKDLAIGECFALHSKDGIRGVKCSTRTAGFYVLTHSTNWYYVGQKDTVYTIPA